MMQGWSYIESLSELDPHVQPFWNACQMPDKHSRNLPVNFSVKLGEFSISDNPVYFCSNKESLDFGLTLSSFNLIVSFVLHCGKS